MVDLPLIVHRPDGRTMFDHAEQQHATDGRLWAQFDAEQVAGTAAMDRELRNNVLGDAVWNALDITARACLASAEKLFRERRNEPPFDFVPVIAAFAKALEIQVNATLRSSLPIIPARARLVKLEQRSVSLDKAGPLSLGQLARAIGREPELNQALTARLNYGLWLTGSLPAILDDFRSMRNTAVHNGRIDQKTATHWRNRMLGVGTEGVFGQLARVTPR